MKKLFLILAACVIAGSCAKNNNTTTGEEAQSYLNLYLQNFYPGVSANENGVYLLEDQPGSGNLWSESTPYTYAVTTIRTIDGTISSTGDETLAKQLGTYTFGNYYGPKFFANGEGGSYAGVDAMLTGMRAGGFRKAIIPSWLITTSRFSTRQAYLDACTSTTPLIYSIRLYGQCEDPLEEQKDSIRRYVAKHYGSQYTYTTILQNNDYDGQFWFLSDTTAFEGVEPRADDAVLKLNYTGRLLNDQVFDTTLEKVAKDAGIYSASRTYTTQSITFNEKYESITMGSSSSLISGFKLALYKMHWQGQKAVVIFTSNWGYETGGSGNIIPGYSPLLFELELL